MSKLRPMGFFGSGGTPLSGEKSLISLIAPAPHPEEDKIIEYLDSGHCVAGCGGVAPDFLNPTLSIRLNMDIYTDGTWEWPAYLSYYVETYHFRVDEVFVQHMARNAWSVPTVSVADLEAQVTYF